VTDLRRVLAERVVERRARAQDDAPRPGSFDELATRPFIRFVTIGNRSGERREKFWLTFAVDGDTVYLVEEEPEHAAWLTNIAIEPAVEVWADERTPRRANARRVADGDERARALRLVRERFDGGQWGAIDGVVVAFDAADGR
jgi:deazaflavin-dependent oxidoreductase (nitroreductase family)